MGKLKNYYQGIFIFIGIAILLFLSFQYARIAHFPTGDDPAIHIFRIKTLTYKELFSVASYPLPLFIFKFVNGLSDIALTRIFTWVISGFLFFSAIAVGIFAKKTSNSWLIGFIAAAVFSVAGWTIDGLRMGLLAESFGWGMLVLALLALASQNLFFVLATGGLLIFSHPFSFTVYVLVSAVYLLILIFSKKNSERNFSLLTLGSFAIILLLVLVFQKDIFLRFTDFINPERAGWGERTLWEILSTYSPRRMIVAFFALIGAVISIKYWEHPGVKITYSLTLVGLFMSMNQIFGISFLVFRFFPYLEMGIAIFAAIGLSFFIQKLLPVNFYLPGFFVVAFLTLLPHYIENGRVTYSQVHDSSINDSMTQGDRAAINWISENISTSEIIAASHKRAIWIRALSSHINNINESFLPNDGTDETLFTKPLAYDYIYFSEANPVPVMISQTEMLVYDQSGVKIYKK